MRKTPAFSHGVAEEASEYSKVWTIAVDGQTKLSFNTV